MTTIPEARHEATCPKCGATFVSPEPIVNTFCSDCPKGRVTRGVLNSDPVRAATPSDGYAAGFRAGVEKAAQIADDQASREADLAEDIRTTSRNAAALACAVYSQGGAKGIATAIRALAPPDADLVVGRLRWVNDGTKLLLGNAWAGWIERMYRSHKWSAYLRDSFISTTSVHLALHDTPEAARAALVAAVRREVEGGDND